MKVVAEDLPTLEFAQDRLSKQIEWLETKPDNVRQYNYCTCSMMGNYYVTDH